MVVHDIRDDVACGAAAGDDSAAAAARRRPHGVRDVRGAQRPYRGICVQSAPHDDDESDHGDADGGGAPAEGGGSKWAAESEQVSSNDVAHKDLVS